MIPGALNQVFSTAVQKCLGLPTRCHLVPNVLSTKIFTKSYYTVSFGTPELDISLQKLADKRPSLHKVSRC